MHLDYLQFLRPQGPLYLLVLELEVLPRLEEELPQGLLLPRLLPLPLPHMLGVSASDGSSLLVKLGADAKAPPTLTRAVDAGRRTAAAPTTKARHEAFIIGALSFSS